MYKALVTDLDGTAVSIGSDGTDVDVQTKDAVQEVSKAGKFITCATGRDWSSSKPVIQSLGITSPCIVEGGTRIIEPQSGDVLWEKYLEESIVDKILEVFRLLPNDGLLMCSSLTDRPNINLVTNVHTRQRYMYLLNVEEATAISMADLLFSIPTIATHLTPSWVGKSKFDIHVTHKGATKEHAISEWQKLVVVHKSETIGMGDSSNDIPIFSAVGLRIAVSTATPDILEQADYIAPAAKDFALKHVIQTFLL